jgi:LPS-assembly lipoprotein
MQRGLASAAPGLPSAGGSLPSRPAWVAARALVAIALSLLVFGCGFHLRGEFTYPFKTVYINSPVPAMAQELKRSIEASGGTRVVDSAGLAEVILEVPAPVDDKQVLSLSGGGRVREFALAKRVSFSLRDAAGKDWLPAAEIVIRRSYTFSESEVLAREAQEVRLLKEMQTDAVQQIVRRLQAAARPG